jgi:hypothetical protein
MTTVLVNRKQGGHFAKSKWTRHAVRYEKGYSSVCGVHIPRPEAQPGNAPVQGEVKNCKTCQRFTDERLWPKEGTSQ